MTEDDKILALLNHQLYYMTSFCVTHSATTIQWTLQDADAFSFEKAWHYRRVRLHTGEVYTQ